MKTQGQNDVSELSDAELNKRVMDRLGLQRQWVVMKGGYYYRPKAGGYTGFLEHAGRYTEEEAKRHAACASGEITAKPAPIPDYCNDLNAMHEAEKLITDPKKLLNYHGHIFRALIDDERCKGILAHPIHATARHRAEAFVKTMEANSVHSA